MIKKILILLFFICFEKVSLMTDNIIYAPNPVEIKEGLKKIFLAGTIDNGDSKNWQEEICSLLKGRNDIVVFNPRRIPWTSDCDIKEQIRWELRRLEESDIILMNILPNSKSPITLLEMGLFARGGKLRVFCNDGFYRFDNVRVTCETYKVQLFTDVDIIDYVKTKII